MHTLQPKHSKLKSDEIKQLLDRYNISVSQLPRIKSNDPGLPEGCQTGDVIQIDRKVGDKMSSYFRVVAWVISTFW